MTVITPGNAIECASCGACFWVPTTREARLRETGGAFYCPNGHQQHFSPSQVKRLEEEAAKLRRELELERSRRMLAEDEIENMRRPKKRRAPLLLGPAKKAQ